MFLKGEATTDLPYTTHRMLLLERYSEYSHSSLI